MTGEQWVTITCSIIGSGALVWVLKAFPKLLGGPVQVADEALDVVQDVMKELRAELDRREKSYKWDMERSEQACKEEIARQDASIQRLLRDNENCNKTVAALRQELSEFKNHAEKAQMRIEAKVDDAAHKLEQSSAEAADRGGRRREDS